MQSVPQDLLKEYVQSQHFTSTTEIMEAMKEMFRDVIQTVMEVEMDEELGRERCERSDEPEGTPRNYRNGYTKKTVKTQLGEVDIKVPRDRNGSFEPKIIGKSDRNADGMEDKILALYACGMSQRDIAAGAAPAVKRTIAILCRSAACYSEVSPAVFAPPHFHLSLGTLAEMIVDHIVNGSGLQNFGKVLCILRGDQFEVHQLRAKTECGFSTIASAFISQALEENWSDVQKSDGYMKYIATRPRAKRLGSHGLFGDKDGVELDKAMAELENYTGNVWTHIISLKREDAERLGYDNARAWRNLLRAHRNDIAATMNIPPQDFRWYAAFHDEGNHPHVHVMAWSAKPNQAYLSQDGIRQIKSKLTNDIFQQEMLHLYEQKTVSRDQLVWEVRQAMRELVQQMKSRICDHPEAERLMENKADDEDGIVEEGLRLYRFP